MFRGNTNQRVTEIDLQLGLQGVLESLSETNRGELGGSMRLYTEIYQLKRECCIKGHLDLCRLCQRMENLLSVRKRCARDEFSLAGNDVELLLDSCRIIGVNLKSISRGEEPPGVPDHLIARLNTSIREMRTAA